MRATSTAAERLVRRKRARGWYTFAFVVALLQGWIVAAPLADCRGQTMAAHVEAPGAQGHFSHDEATCAACSVMALQLIAPAVPALELPDVQVRALIPHVAHRAGGSWFVRARSRAPALRVVI